MNRPVALFCTVEPAQKYDELLSTLRRYGIETRVIELDSTLRHDADLAAQRFLETAQQLRESTLTYIGINVTAAGAIIAAAQRPDIVSAVVSINGRTDLAADYLRELKTPTLLLVNDMPVLRMNREAVQLMRCEKRIEILHGNLDDVIAQKALRWLTDKLALVPADAVGIV